LIVALVDDPVSLVGNLVSLLGDLGAVERRHIARLSVSAARC